MSSMNALPDEVVPEIIGYVQPWIVSPGDTMDVKVSCTEAAYTSRLIRLIQGHEGDHLPAKEDEHIEVIRVGTHRGRFQIANPGSYAIIENAILTAAAQRAKRLAISLHFCTHLPLSGHPQCIVSTLDSLTHTGFAVSLDDKGKIYLSFGNGHETEIVPTNFQAEKKQWCKLCLSFDLDGSLDLEISPVPHFSAKPAQSSYRLSESRLRYAIKRFNFNTLLFAARRCRSRQSELSSTSEFLNGRIANPALAYFTDTEGWQTMARYDFAEGMETDTISDTSGHAAHGQLINAPTRAVTDHTWDGTEVDWTKAQRGGYGSIHFHEDDLDDAGWKTDFRLSIPHDARSGAYAIRVQTTNRLAKDDLVFFVRPTSASTVTVGPRTAFVLSTFTYLAYANERMYDQSKPSRLEQPSSGFAVQKDAHFERMRRRTDLGLSLYDVHRDESGVVYSSPRRPLLNMRPDYIHWALHRPREFSADLLMIGFLEHLGIPYDVITDHDMHLSGLDDGHVDLRQYDVLITGCHPEYPTLRSLDAYSSFLRTGGSLMYLGGNGFYWTTALHNSSRFSGSHGYEGRLEVRRGDQGIRTYTMPGGERHFSANGQRGTLWRSLGRPANVLVGVGSAGEGLGAGVPYCRTAASRTSQYSWMFDGIDADLIGVDGFGGGASGDEFDKYDVQNGSPADAVVLATSTGHPDEFGIFIEEVGFPIRHTLGSQTREIRSDMVCYEAVGGGHVFAVGSINWLSCLAWKAFDNDVARLTENVLRGFLERHKRSLGPRL